MVSWSATVGGSSVQKIYDVHWERGETGKLGKATIHCINNSHNRSFGSGDKVHIDKNGGRVFSGFVTGKPTKAGGEQTTLEIEAKDTRLELIYEQANRVFYNMDTGNIIKEALNYRVNPKDRQYAHTGSSTSNWSSDAPVFELGDIPSQTLYDAGHDFLFVGWHKGASGTYSATYTNVGAKAIPGDGQIDRMETRLLVNNRGQQFEVEVDLRDNAGNNYIWPLDLRGNDFTVHDLKADEATPEASIGTPLGTNGAIQYRFKITGELPESRAAAIDYARTYPFKLNNRSTTLTDGGIQTTGNTVTRRVDSSIFDMIQDFAKEDNFISYSTVQDVLHYEASGRTSALSITHSSTPVVAAEFDRDYENVVNKVTVQGAGDIRVTVTDDQSIKYYGVAPRERPIVDESIQSEEAAVNRGRGFLKKNAWADTAFSFEVADTSFKDTTLGEDIYVKWPPENIDGTYAVSEVEANKHGIVTIGLTATEAL